MAFVKDTSYREMPFSSETPGDEFYAFFTVTELVSRMRKKEDQVFKCRTVGTVNSYCGKHFIYELDNNDLQIRISLAHARTFPPFPGQPYPAQLFGSVQWKDDVGLVIYAYILQSIPACLAIRLRDTIKSVVNTHGALVDVERKDQ